MYINLGRFLSSELLQLIFFCEYWRLFHTSSCGPLIILYLLYLVFTVLFQYFMSMALFQYTCTEPKEVTPYKYLEYKEMGIVIDVQKASHSKTGECVTLYLRNGIISVKMFWQQKDLAIFAITVVFFCETFMLWSFILRNYLWCKLCWMCAVF